MPSFFDLNPSAVLAFVHSCPWHWLALAGFAIATIFIREPKSLDESAAKAPGYFGGLYRDFAAMLHALGFEPVEFFAAAGRLLLRIVAPVLKRGGLLSVFVVTCAFSLSIMLSGCAVFAAIFGDTTRDKAIVDLATCAVDDYFQKGVHDPSTIAKDCLSNPTDVVDILVGYSSAKSGAPLKAGASNATKLGYAKGLEAAMLSSDAGAPDASVDAGPQ